MRRYWHVVLRVQVSCSSVLLVLVPRLSAPRECMKSAQSTRSKFEPVQSDMFWVQSKLVQFYHGLLILSRSHLGIKPDMHDLGSGLIFRDNCQPPLKSMNMITSPSWYSHNLTLYTTVNVYVSYISWQGDGLCTGTIIFGCSDCTERVRQAARDYTYKSGYCCILFKSQLWTS